MGNYEHVIEVADRLKVSTNESARTAGVCLEDVYASNLYKTTMLFSKTIDRNKDLGERALKVTRFAILNDNGVDSVVCEFSKDIESSKRDRLELVAATNNFLDLQPKVECISELEQKIRQRMKMLGLKTVAVLKISKHGDSFIREVCYPGFITSPTISSPNFTFDEYKALFISIYFLNKAPVNLDSPVRV